MAADGTPGLRVGYRCHACAFEFAVGTPGVVPCPRCGAIGDHERVGAVGGDATGGPP